MLATAAPAAHLAHFLSSAELVGSTSPIARPPVVAETRIDRSFRAAAKVWATVAGQPSSVGTAVPDQAPLLFGPKRIEDGLIAQIREFERLESGWDGENAAQPRPTAIQQALDFLRAAGDLAEALEPTLHVDGSVVFEVDSGEGGSLLFKGDGRAVYAIKNFGRGQVTLKKFSVPEELRRALSA